ncbi:MAG: hypothetical protein R6U38_04680 [Desulfatiglandaceae bacterium]
MHITARASASIPFKTITGRAFYPAFLQYQQDLAILVIIAPDGDRKKVSPNPVWVSRVNVPGDIQPEPWTFLLVTTSPACYYGSTASA